jgi:hypothetical protein
VIHTTVSQNSTACWAGAGARKPRIGFGASPSPVDVPGRSGVSTDRSERRAGTSADGVCSRFRRAFPIRPLNEEGIP